MTAEADIYTVSQEKEAERLLDYYRHQWKKKPTSWYFFPLAQMYFRKERFEEAYKICQKGLQTQPYLWAARVVFAQACLELNKTEEAETQLKMVLKELPNNLLASKLLAQIYLQQGRLGAACQCYKSIRNYYPECLELEEVHKRLEEVELRKAQLLLNVLDKWQTALTGFF